MGRFEAAGPTVIVAVAVWILPLPVAAQYGEGAALAFLWCAGAVALIAFVGIVYVVFRVVRGLWREARSGLSGRRNAQRTSLALLAVPWIAASVLALGAPHR